MTDYMVEFSGWHTSDIRSIFMKKKRYTDTDIGHVLSQAKKDAREINAEVFSIFEFRPTRYLGTWEKKSGRWYLCKE